MDAEASPLDIRGPKQPYPTGETYKSKRKALTEEQKAARKQKRDARKKELA